MKKAFVLISFLLATMGGFAQGSLDKGELQLNGGFGFSGWGIPIYLGADYAVHPDITVGAEFGYRSYKNSVNYGTGTQDFGASIINIGANGNFHFDKYLKVPEKWDLYAGLTLGYYIWSYNDSKYNTAGASGIGFSGQAGARYFFTDNLGVNLEFAGGSATSGGKIGVTYKL